jgi:hypothetical protein
MSSDTESESKALVEIYFLNQEYMPFLNSLNEAGLLDPNVDRENFDEFARMYGYRDVEQLLTHMEKTVSKELADDWRNIVYKSIAGSEVEAIRTKVQSTIDEKMPGYMAKIEKKADEQ